MSYTRIITCALAAAGMFIIGSQASALVLCANAAGIVYALQACGSGQTQVNPVALGYRGPRAIQDLLAQPALLVRPARPDRPMYTLLQVYQCPF